MASGLPSVSRPSGGCPPSVVLYWSRQRVRACIDLSDERHHGSVQSVHTIHEACLDRNPFFLWRSIATGRLKAYAAGALSIHAVPLKVPAERGFDFVTMRGKLVKDGFVHLLRLLAPVNVK